MHRKDSHLLGDLQPGLFEAEHRAAVQRRCDLEHSVVVMETAADIGHSHPFLNDHHPSDHIVTAQDLCGNKVAYLSEERGKRRADTQYCFRKSINRQMMSRQRGFLDCNIHH